MSGEFLAALQHGGVEAEWASLWGGGESEFTTPGCVWKGPKNVGRPAPLGQMIGMTTALLRAGIRKRYGSVVCLHVGLLPVAAMVATWHRVPLAVAAHGIEVWSPLPRVRRAVLRRARQVWSVSRATDEQLVVQQQVHPDRIRRLVVPVADRFLQAPERKRSLTAPPIVLTVARLTRRNAYKGVDKLLAAWPDVVNAEPQARLVVVGDGDNRAALESSLASSTRVSVDFIGLVDDDVLAKRYESASVFALPGRQRLHPALPEGEGFGLVFLEAGAFGLPVVAGDAGGARDAVVHGRTGLLVDPEDPKAVASAVLELLHDRRRADLMGATGSVRVRHEFSTKAFRTNVNALLTGLLAESARS